MKRIVIADTSCLIILSKIKLLDILQKLFGEVWITEDIKVEFGEDLPNWIVVKAVENQKIELILNLNLDKGESSAIALCIEQIEEVLLIVDERKGRKIAQELGIKIIGTLGIILRASQLGIIPNLKEVIDQMEDTDFRLSPILKQQLLNTK